ncbi:hypothetical protein [Actinophytocola sediminis]
MANAEQEHTPATIATDRISVDVFHSGEINLIGYTKNARRTNRRKCNGLAGKATILVDR